MHHRIPETAKIGAAVGWQATLDLDVILADVIKHMRMAGLPAPEPEAVER
jgi:hypothetical protein